MRGHAHLSLVLTAVGLVVVAAATSASIGAGSATPRWTGPFLDPLKEFGGALLAENVTIRCLYRATLALGRQPLRSQYLSAFDLRAA